MQGALVGSLPTQLLFLGGSLMKFARFMTLAALVAMSAVAVNAGSIKPKSQAAPDGDPKLNINKPMGGVAAFHPLTTIDFGDSVSDSHTPLMVTYAELVGGTMFDFTGPANIHQMYIDITGIPSGEQFNLFTCSSNIFASFGMGNCGAGVPDGSQIGFKLFDGTLMPGPIDITITNPTPEPSTLLMFLSLGPAIGFAKKRWSARQSA
jgi:hypothetical protein